MRRQQGGIKRRAGCYLVGETEEANRVRTVKNPQSDD